MSDELDEAGLRAWEAFVFAHAAAIGAIERDISREDSVSLTCYDVLVALVNAPDHRLRLNELADQVVLSRSGLSRLLDRIEQAGLIRREPAPGDRRGAFAVLTEAGVQAQRKTWPHYARGINRYFSQYLTDEEKRVIATALQRVRENVMNER
ncbi:MAG TPA: MarR family transcriptional regulator [Thermomicrobiales bacterium]|jgi:DNA-binding MarR family transcriptional regulator|nr:MarR family transcriptional regulator [Thermomicrobiales bacterium]